MKKVYLQPSVIVHKMTVEPILLPVSQQKGDAGEVHAGGAGGDEDERTTPGMGGTGDDSGFELG